jgi:restriction system protein
MTPRAYEELVAAHFRERGYTTELTPSCSDYGVDVFASKDDQRLAIQAKMYGGTARKVNRDMIMQLHGAKDYFDCTGAMIVTDGEVADSARKVAEKLNIKILRLVGGGEPDPTPTSAPPADTNSPLPSEALPNLSFEQVWERHVMPLAGQTIVGSDGRRNTLVRVDWSGVKRITSSGREQFIPVEVFRRAVNRIFERGCVSRAEINDDYAKRASSGVVLILSQVPLFEHKSGPSRLDLRSGSPAAKKSG